MPKQKRFKTNYPGVYYVKSKAVGRSGIERIYYIRYKRDGKTIEEKAGRQYQNDMTPARAAGVRAQRVEGKQKSNVQQRKIIRSKITVQSLADEYFSLKSAGNAKQTNYGI
jgi:hypothetical protein